MMVVPDEVHDYVPLWDDFLEGRFLSTTPHVAKVHVIVNKIWPLGDKTVKIDVFIVNATTMNFRIRDSSVRARQLRRGMWNIADIPMVVSKWTSIIDEKKIGDNNYTNVGCYEKNSTYHVLLEGTGFSSECSR